MPFQKGNKLAVGNRNYQTGKEAWENVGSFLVTEGAEAYVNLMRENIRENPDKFVAMFHTVIEYFKPKLARKEVDVNNNGPVTINLLQFNSAPITPIPNESSGDDWDQLAVATPTTVSGRSVQLVQ
jgi:hypothetical protein